MTATITDDELRADGWSEYEIDELNRDPATQKPDGRDARDREAVLRTRRDWNNG